MKEDFDIMNLAQAYWFSTSSTRPSPPTARPRPWRPTARRYLNLARALLNEGHPAGSQAGAQQALDKGVRNPADAKKILSAAK